MIPTNCLCWKIPLCAYWAKKGNMIISIVIIFNQPWFHCYFLLNKHTASCNFITQWCSHFSLLLLPLCFLNPKFTFTLKNVLLLSPQSQYLMTPSQPHVATFEVSWGCHSTPTHTSSCALNLLYSFVVFQSHTYTLPSASPEIK